MHTRRKRFIDDLSISPARAVSGFADVAQDYQRLCELVADRITALVQSKPDAVLGLATGSTPLGVYDLLAQRHQSAGLDFSRVTCFNLDEYYPMPAESPQSYHQFMWKNLFHRINCCCWAVPDGCPRSEEEIAHDCRDYEAQIVEAGGIDLQLLGIGRSGHIGFNEPGSPPASRTRLVTLHPITRQDAADSFGGLGNVPHQAVSMGIGTILEAREIVMMASGTAKAGVVQASWTQKVSRHVPASWIRTHQNARLYLDKNAASFSLDECL